MITTIPINRKLIFDLLLFINSFFLILLGQKKINYRILRHFLKCCSILVNLNLPLFVEERAHCMRHTLTDLVDQKAVSGVTVHLKQVPAVRRTRRGGVRPAGGGRHHLVAGGGRLVVCVSCGGAPCS